MIGYYIYLKEEDEVLCDVEGEPVWFNSKKEVREYLELGDLKGTFLLIPVMKR